MPGRPPRRAFARFAWAFAFYLIGVILFGAWVRITHSGAGCGSHWPTCGGEIVPVAPRLETIIEFSHRLTSGLCGVLALVLVGWSWRIERFGPMTKTAALTLAFIVLEGAIGAGLVLGELVGDDDSAARAIVISLHLANTLLLMSCAALTAWQADGNRLPTAGARRVAWIWGPALAALVLTSMSGAVTALGDTLFPIDPTLGPGLFDKIRQDLSATNHFLVRLRVWHPFLAVAAAAYLVWIFRRNLKQPGAGGWPRLGLGLAVGELALGAANVALAAPGWMQLLHLLAAHLLWMATLLSGAEDAAAAETSTAVEPTAPARAGPLVPAGSARPSRPA